MRELIEYNQNQGMYYAVRSKPESLLYYPIFKIILQEGQLGTDQDEFNQRILTQIKKYQDQVSTNNQLKSYPESHRRLDSGRADTESDMPLLSKETL